MNLTLTPAETKKLRWLLNVILEDQEQFLIGETDPDAMREAQHAKRGAEKLLKRLDICTCGNRRCRCRPRRQAGIDLATLLGCAEADLLGFLDALDVSAQDKEHPAAQTVRDLHVALKQIQPSHACSVDDHGGARHLRLRQPQVQMSSCACKPTMPAGSD